MYIIHLVGLELEFSLWCNKQYSIHTSRCCLENCIASGIAFGDCILHMWSNSCLNNCLENKWTVA